MRDLTLQYLNGAKTCEFLFRKLTKLNSILLRGSVNGKNKLKYSRIIIKMRVNRNVLRKKKFQGILLIIFRKLKKLKRVK